MTAGLEIVEVAPDAPEAVALIRALDEEISQRFPGGIIHGLNEGDAEVRALTMLVARMDGNAVGCGALREIEPGLGEIKRMFVRAEGRGRGLARKILAALEAIARARGYRALRLETGGRMPEAITLYISDGYRPIAPYGEYEDDPRSLCFEKSLTDAAPRAAIVRMWHGRVPAAKAAAYRAFLDARAVPDYASVPGNVSVHILERAEGDVTHFVTMTLWTSLDAIRRFAGDDVTLAKYYPEDAEFLLEFEPRVVHYEVAGRS